MQYRYVKYAIYKDRARCYTDYGRSRDRNPYGGNHAKQRYTAGNDGKTAGVSFFASELTKGNTHDFGDLHCTGAGSRRGSAGASLYFYLLYKVVHFVECAILWDFVRF